MAINEYLNGAKVNFPTPFFLAGKAPLDIRSVVSTKANLTLNNFKDGEDAFWYIGMIVGCQEDGKVYILKSESEGFVEVGKETPLDGYATETWVETNYAKKSDLSSVYKYKESVEDYDALPTDLTANEAGYVYNVESTGDNYAWTGDAWDKLGGTVDLSDINERLDTLDQIISGGEGEGITDLIAGKQDKLEDGSSNKPHLVWSPTNQKWASGKINIDSIVPSENKAANSVLAYDGAKVIWTTVEVQPELPAVDKVSGKILTVSNDGINVEWADAPNSTAITTTNNVSTISNGTVSTEVYTKAGVINLLSWESL